MAHVLHAVCLVVAVLAVSTVAREHMRNDEQRLARELLARYKVIGRYGRPVENVKDPWDVSLSLSLNAILEVDAKSQTIVVTGMENMGWTDVNLKWDMNKFDVRTLRLNADDIIMPDVTLYNAANTRKILTRHDTVVVHNNGNINYVPAVKLTAVCPMDVSNRTLTCTLKYGSWSYDGDMMNLTMTYDQVDVSYFTPNPEWELESTEAKRTVKQYPCCPESYIDITYKLNLKRKDISKPSKVSKSKQRGPNEI